MGKKKCIKKSTIIKCSLWILCIYLAFTSYFSVRFCFGSAINEVKVAGKTVDEVKKELGKEVEKYSLVIVGRDDKKETIVGKDIDISFNITEENIEELMEEESAFAWVNSIFNSKSHKIEEEYSFNNDLLSEKINSLEVLKEENQIAPTNPKLIYENGEYRIESEEYGSQINKEVLAEGIKKAVREGRKVVDLEELNCYINPSYTKDSEEVLNAKKTLDLYVSSNIKFKFKDKSQTINGDVIKDWVTLDKNYNVGINEGKVINYVSRSTSSYSTVGRSRKFKSSTGKIVDVKGGDYGKSTNNSIYVKELVEAIKQGSTDSKEYNIVESTTNGVVSDIGNTYVEINLTKQYIWCYKNGQLVTEGPIVTGSVKDGWATPQGTYKLKYKTTDVVLRGPGYASPVTFWMPFNGGIGLHDATWRNSFGGEIYKDSGSHGCINLQYNVAKTIYNNINSGDPVICYFE